MAGILAYGAYIPLYRLSRDEIARVWDGGSGGGLKSFGHPVGASGCCETYEIYKQTQGKAEEPSRQLKNVELGLVHNQGGLPGKFICSVMIIGVP